MNKPVPMTFDTECGKSCGSYIDIDHLAAQLGSNNLKRPERLDDWFYMVMKEMRRNGYVDVLENWDITYDEALEIQRYIKEKLNVKF